MNSITRLALKVVCALLLSALFLTTIFYGVIQAGKNIEAVKMPPAGAH